MTVSSKTDLRFPKSGQQGHEARIIQIKQKIASTYAKKIASAGYEPIMRKDCSDFQFYIKPGKKVVVCFGPYQPMGGNGHTSIELKGKLK
jgi:hypothetical protein